jgi:hypothetical protein
VAKPHTCQRRLEDIPKIIPTVGTIFSVWQGAATIVMSCGWVMCLCASAACARARKKANEPVCNHMNCRIIMVGLNDVQAALNAPGLVTATPLSFNQLKVEIAKRLHIEVDDAVFNDHKQAIKDSYVKVYSKVCEAPKPAATKPAATKPAASKPAAPKPAARAAPAKKPARKRQDSESEEDESDASESGSESEESDKGGRKASAFGSDPEVRRLTGIAKYASPLTLNQTRVKMLRH